MSRRLRRQPEARERVPRALQRFLAMSRAKVWDEAKKEWRFTGKILGRDDAEFTGECGLCHQPNLDEQYEIENLYTGARLLVGSDCVRHSLYLDGVDSLEDSRRRFDRQVERIKLLEGVLRPAAAAILAGSTKWEHVGCLIRGVLIYTDCRSMKELRARVDRDPELWRRLVSELSGVPYDELGPDERRRLRDALFEPRKVTSLPPSLRRNPTAAEIRRLAARRWGKGRGRVVLGGVGRGAHTRPAQDQFQG